MRATTRFLLLGAFAMCLSACLPEPPAGSEAAIFKNSPSRYGWGARRPGPDSNSPKPPPQQQQSRSNNRFGHTDQKKPDSGPSSQNDSGNPGGPDSGTGPDSNSGNSSGNITDIDSSGADDDKKKMTDGGNSSGGNSSPPSTPPSNLNEYPYARLVPGKKGFVTLSGANAGVGEIDVTGIKPGTPVEIDDPRNPSKKIYFRVP